MKALHESFEVEPSSIVTHFCGAVVRIGDPRPDERRLREIRPDQLWQRAEYVSQWRCQSSKGSLEHKVSKLHYRG